MQYVFLIGGLVVIGGFFTITFLRSSKNKAEPELLEFAETVPAPLTPEVRKWLAPQLARRTTYPTLGWMWGLFLSSIPLTDGWHDLPWFWMAGLIGAGAGGTAGALLAGYRTAPLLDGPLRTADAVRRRPSDHLEQSEITELRLAAVLAPIAFVLAVAVQLSADTPSSRRAVLGCGLGLLLVAAYCWVIDQIVTRPMVTSSPEGLVWQKALVTKTVDPMPSTALLVAVFSSAVAIFASVVSYQELSLAVVLLTAPFALVTATAAVVFGLGLRRAHRDSQSRTAHRTVAP